MNTTPQSTPTQGGRLGLAARFLAVLVALFAMALVIGGFWLISLGGSADYGLAGIALLVAAVLLWRLKAAALNLVAAIWLLSLAWALWEVGLNAWGLVPRLVAISVVLLLVALVSRVRLKAVLTFAAVAYGSGGER